MRHIIVLTTLGFLVGQPVLAADQIAVPEGCSPVVTIMKNGCNASTVFDCGSSKETHTYTKGKMRVVHAYKSDWELEEFRFADRGGAQMTAVPDTGSNMQIDTLLETGNIEESGDFLLNTGVIEDKKYNMRGRVELSGEEATYSGVIFKKGRIFRTFERNRMPEGWSLKLTSTFQPIPI